MAFDAFLKLDGIDGESRDDKHKGEIEIESFSFGEANYSSAASGSGGGAGKVQMQDFHFTMKTTKASPLLFLSCATGKHIKEGLITLRKAGEKPLEYLKIKLTDVLVTSFNVGGFASSGEPVPTEEMSLNFAAVEISYSEQRSDGSLGDPITVSFNRKTNTAG